MKLVKFIFLIFYISNFFLTIIFKKKEKSIKKLFSFDLYGKIIFLFLYRILFYILFIQLFLEEVSIHSIFAFLLLYFLIKNINIRYVYSVNTIFKRSYFLLYGFYYWTLWAKSIWLVKINTTLHRDQSSSISICMLNEAFFATSIGYFSLDLTVYRKTNGNQIEEYRFCSPNINIFRHVFLIL